MQLIILFPLNCRVETQPNLQLKYYGGPTLPKVRFMFKTKFILEYLNYGISSVLLNKKRDGPGRPPKLPRSIEGLRSITQFFRSSGK